MLKIAKENMKIKKGELYEYKFGLIIRKPKTTYINILNAFDYDENIVEINGNKYNLTKKQFVELKNLIDKNLKELLTISKEQTLCYLDENGLDGYAENITILLGGIQIFVNFAIADKKVKDYGNLLLEKIENIIVG